MAGVHAKKGPSGAERLHACPGALPLIATIPEDERAGSGPAAQLGTAAHFLLEKCLTERIPPSEFHDRIIELIGDKEDGSMLRAGAKQPKGDRVWFRVDDDMVDGVTLAYDYVLKRLAEVEDCKLMLESKTNPVPDRDDTWGTADVTIDSPFVLLEVVDYKNGYGLVEHRDNPQLLSYLAGRAHDTGWSHNEYQITVVQPNAAHDDGRIRPFSVSREALLAFVDKHRAAAELSDLAADVLQDECDGDVNHPLELGGTWAEAYLHVGDHCTFCEAAVICPAKKRWMQNQAQVDFDDDPPVIEDGFSLSAIEASKVLAWAPYLQRHIKAAKEVEKREVMSGRPMPGRKTVRNKSRGRKWKDDSNPHAVAAEMVKKGYVNDNERARLFTEPKLITGPQAEKLVPPKLRKGFEADFLIKPPGSLTTAPLDDPREAATINPGDDFPDDDGGSDD